VRKKTLRAGDLPVCAEQFLLRAAINRSVRPFSSPCGDNSIRADTLAFRASQLPVRAGKNPSVRPFFDLCAEKAEFWKVLANSHGQKATVKPLFIRPDSAVDATYL
jgi:hypothetical protein